MEHNNKRENTHKNTQLPLSCQVPRSKFQILQSASLSTSRTGLDRQGTQCQKKVSKERHGVHDCYNMEMVENRQVIGKLLLTSGFLCVCQLY